MDHRPSRLLRCHVRDVRIVYGALLLSLCLSLFLLKRANSWLLTWFRRGSQKPESVRIYMLEKRCPSSGSASTCSGWVSRGIYGTHHDTQEKTLSRPRSAVDRPALRGAWTESHIPHLVSPILRFLLPSGIYPTHLCVENPFPPLLRV